MRKDFADQLYKEMKKNKKIYLLTGDLGFRYFDKIQEDFPDRFVNCGASEQAMMGIAIGLALEGKIPVVYSITTFLLNRPFEWIRNYVDHEGVPIKLVGSGRNREYEHDEFSHFAEDTRDILNLFPNIVQYWPSDGDGVKHAVSNMIKSSKPSFLSLSRR